MLGSIVGVRLMTGLLDPAAYGELALGMTAAMLVNQAILGPLLNGVSRFYAPAKEEGDLPGYLAAVRRMAMSATALIASIAVCACAGLAIAGRSAGPDCARGARVRHAQRLQRHPQRHPECRPPARHRRPSPGPGVVGAVSRRRRGDGVARLQQPRGDDRVHRERLPWCSSRSACSFKGWRRRGRTRRAGPDGGHTWAYSWPFSTFGIFTWVQLASDRWALGMFGSTRDIGLFAVLFQVGYYPASLATGLAMQFLAPILYQRIRRRRRIARGTRM